MSFCSNNNNNNNIFQTRARLVAWCHRHSEKKRGGGGVKKKSMSWYFAEQQHTRQKQIELNWGKAPEYKQKMATATHLNVWLFLGGEMSQFVVNNTKNNIKVGVRQTYYERHTRKKKR